MQIHELQPKTKNKTRKRIGRGGAHGTFSGRGVKGQKSRAGTRKGEPIIRGIIKRYPKLRGFRANPDGKPIVGVNLVALDKFFSDGDKVTPQLLLEKKIIRRIKGKTPQVKILGYGDLTKKLTFDNCSFSKTAQQKLKIKN